MKILYFGSVIAPEDCIKRLGPSIAGNKMQMGILRGLQNEHPDISILSEIPIAAFPKEKKIVIGRKKIPLNNCMEAITVPFVNIFIAKQLTMIVFSFLELLKWTVKNLREKKVIITFNAFPYISLPTVLISKMFNIKTICIFADPPIEVVDRKGISKIIKEIEKKSTERNIKKYDGIVTLNTKAMEKYAKHTRYVLVDGGFDSLDIPQKNAGGQWNTFKEGDIIDLVFSGGLYEYNGIKNLIDAFKIISNDKIRLNIYGEGPLRDFVSSASEIDERIIYHGNVSNEEILSIQQKAGILINPRAVDELVSLYTFPSKMIEYMLSGTPVITTRLNGLTQDYLSNLFVLNDDSIKGIAKGIEEVISMRKDSLIEIGTNAREFIIHNKNWGTQSKKIYNFIKEIV